MITIFLGLSEAKMSILGKVVVALTIVSPKCWNNPSPVNIPMPWYAGLGSSSATLKVLPAESVKAWGLPYRRLPLSA